MHEERYEHNLMSQIAGIIAMMSALVKTLPPSTRKRLVHQTHAEFESLLAAMSTTSASQVQTEREGVEWMRDLFLKRIAQADSKQKRRKVPKAAEDPGQSTALDTRSQANERPSSTDVDFEL
jgi:hypothetical protein